LVLKLLVSGGVGYIGTHSIIEIMNAEHDISEIDDLSKSHIAALPWVKHNLAFVQADLCDTTSVVRQFKCARLASTTAFQSACPRRVPAPLG
jgi:UDP-glucose 4-epimerase